MQTRSQAWWIQGQTDKILITSPSCLLLVCVNHTSPASHPNQELQPQNLTQGSHSGKMVQDHYFFSLSCWPISQINNKIHSGFSVSTQSLTHIQMYHIQMAKTDTSTLLPIVTVPCFGTENYFLFLNKENNTKIYVHSPIIF